jgi:hypothetical protein
MDEFQAYTACKNLDYPHVTCDFYRLNLVKIPFIMPQPDYAVFPKIKRSSSI